MNTHRTTVITVNYNSSDVIECMLGSCEGIARNIVVDNASKDRDALRALCEKHGAELIENDENIGFGRGCNLGAQAATSEFLLFLNPDASLEEGALGHLEQSADAMPETGAFNPLILGLDGNQLFKHKSDLIPKSEYMGRNGPVDGDRITTMSGAAIFVRREDFEQLGGFDPNIFLFYEDDDIALRLRKAGRELRICRDAVVRHIGGGGSGDAGYAGEAFKAWHMGFSRVYSMRKHNMPFTTAKTVGKAVLRVLDPAVLFSKMRRVKRVALLRGTLAALRKSNA